ncbi:MAG TPA: hypothetical protein VGH38_29435, partial [Bryobacteraceae bacterium]
FHVGASDFSQCNMRRGLDRQFVTVSGLFRIRPVRPIEEINLRGAAAKPSQEMPGPMLVRLTSPEGKLGHQWTTIEVESREAFFPSLA